MVKQSTDYFSTCSNGTNGTNRPFVFARLTSVNKMEMVYRSTEELTIVPMVRIVWLL